MKKIIALFLVCFAAITVQAQESEKAWTLSLDQGLYDKYVWRGIQYNEQGVNQGAIDFKYDTGDMGVFGINVWYNLDLDDENGVAGHFSEVDYTASWSKAFGDLTLGAGHIYYDFSDVGAGSTREVYVSAQYNMLLLPKLTVYYDYEDVDGFYVDFAVGHTFDLKVAGMTLDIGANIGWADADQASAYYGGETSSGFTNWGSKVALNIPITANFKITPSVAYYSLLDDANSGTGEDDDFIYGINLNFTF